MIIGGNDCCRVLTVWQCWPSLGYKQRAVPSRKDSRSGWCPHYLWAADDSETVTVADVRAVPLEQLSADDDARHNAARVLGHPERHHRMFRFFHSNPPPEPVSRAMSAPISQYVLKVHGRCILACDHCYVYEQADQSWRHKPAAISIETAEMAPAGSRSMPWRTG